MTDHQDWRWKLEQAIERIRTRYEHIGRKTGAPFLAVVYPPDAERQVLREWRTLVGSLGPEFEVTRVDVLEVTSDVVGGLGVETVVHSLEDAMPGSDPHSELGGMWARAVADRIREAVNAVSAGRPVVYLERLAALYPAATPRAVMQMLWDTSGPALNGPVVILIPGILVEPRVYSFVGKVQELMYRGDIL